MMWPTVLLQGVHCTSGSLPQSLLTPLPKTLSVFSGGSGFWLMDPSFQLSWQDQQAVKAVTYPQLRAWHDVLFIYSFFSVYSLHSSSWWTCLKVPWPLCRIQEMKGINSQRSQISILMITGNVNLVKKSSTWNMARQVKSLSKPA